MPVPKHTVFANKQPLAGGQGIESLLDSFLNYNFHFCILILFTNTTARRMREFRLSFHRNILPANLATWLTRTRRLRRGAIISALKSDWLGAFAARILSHHRPSIIALRVCFKYARIALRLA